MTIRFGTDGWRAVIADGYTFDRVRAAARGMARYVQWEGRENLTVYARHGEEGGYPAPWRAAARGLVVGYDTRFLSARFAAAVAEEVAAMGVPVLLSDTFAPTPAISLAIRDWQTAGAIIVTASHNPPEYNGLKFKPEYASSGMPEVMDAIIPFVHEELARATAPRETPAAITHFSPLDGYRKQLTDLVDLGRIARSDLDVVVDPMHGAGVGVVRSLLPGVREVRATPDPTFGGYNPEPIDRNLPPLREALRNSPRNAPESMRIGIATDGDADRIGAMDGTGHFFNSHEIFAILLWHLVTRKGWGGGVVKTFSTSNMIGTLARHFGLPVYETPIGFKYIVENMLNHDILIGGEESGGIGIRNHIPERDGVLSGLLLLEAAAWENESVAQVLERVHAITGACTYDRVDLHLPSREQMAGVVEQLQKTPPRTIGGSDVQGVETSDGVKFLLENNAWILFRPSGTEPVLRVYVEAPTRNEVRDILEDGEQMALRGAGATARTAGVRTA